MPSLNDRASARGWLAVAVLLLSSGCAMQADMMRMDADMKTVRELQDTLDAQVAAASEAVTRISALEERLNLYEERLDTETSAALNEGLPQTAKRAEQAVRDLRQASADLGKRVAESEHYFLTKLTEFEQRQKEFTGDASALQQRAAEWEERLVQVDALINRLSASEQIAERRGEEMIALQTRLEGMELALRSVAQEGMQRDQALAGQVAQTSGQLSLAVQNLEKSQQEASGRMAGTTDDLVKWLRQQLEALEQQVTMLDAQQVARVEEEQRALQSEVQNLKRKVETTAARPTGPVASDKTVAQLSDRIEALESAQENLPLEDNFNRLTRRVTALEKDSPDVAKLTRRLADLERRAEHLRRVEELTLQLGELGRQVTQRVDAEQNDFAAIDARLSRLEGSQKRVAIDLLKRLRELEEKLDSLSGQGG
ncbi:MAG: hypothetical protein OEY97_07330 [Nitrospirota bacterium]|nr:hypothetical protein [Nitrospirota bacterium]